MFTIRLIYASDAREGLLYRDFMNIMETAANANSLRSVTGLLCYGGGRFLQVLEGERSVVNNLYRHITTDDRHTNCELLLVEDITDRKFGEWSMKIVDWSDAATAARHAETLSRAGIDHFNPDRMTGVDALAFLSDVAEAERQLMV